MPAANARSQFVTARRSKPIPCSPATCPDAPGGSSSPASGRSRTASNRASTLSLPMSRSVDPRSATASAAVPAPPARWQSTTHRGTLSTDPRCGNARRRVKEVCGDSSGVGVFPAATGFRSTQAHVASRLSSSKIATLRNRPSQNCPYNRLPCWPARQSGSLRHFMNQRKLARRCLAFGHPLRVRRLLVDPRVQTLRPLPHSTDAGLRHP